MKPIECNLFIQAPPERVFAVASNFAHAPEFIPGITKVEMLTEGPVGVGTRFKETRKFMGKEATETMELTGFDPPRSYTLGCHSCGADCLSRISFQPEGQGTRLTFQFEMKPVSFFAKLMSPLSGLMAGTMKKCFVGDMEAIKAAAEAR